MGRIKRWWRAFFQCSMRDIGITASCLIVACGLSALLQPVSENDAHVPLIFVLAVILVSRLTEGLVLGFFASAVAVLAVNYAFTFPYFKLNFSLTGYPLTFLCFLAVALITCTLTSRLKAGERARTEAEREKMRANLLRAISHDLRTPLTSIVGALNVATENGAQLSAAEKNMILTDARRDAEWLINMVENLLSITRMEGSGEPKIHKEPQVVEEVVGEAVSRFRKQYPEICVKIHVPEEILFVPMDAILVEQVIMNLLVNAAVHGGGATEILVSVERTGSLVRVRVEDNGRGFDSKVMQHLFDGTGSQRAHGNGSDSVRTMGIGLSVCRTIVAAHGGTMRAENTPASGARVEFTLEAEEENYAIAPEGFDC